MSDLDSLLHRYLDDRASLAPRELDDLIAALRADPEQAASLRDQLLLDDLLAQKLTLDRRNFVAQVEQRIADLNRGHTELNRQVADLRSLAAAEKSGSASPSAAWRWSKNVLALSMCLVLGLGAYFVSQTSNHQPSIAKVTALDGSVTIEQNGESEPAALDGSLESGQQITVPRGGSITFTYQDGTELRIKGNSSVTFADQPAAAKQIRIDRGEVVASIKPQIAGPMRFTTPHAVASAPASLIRLVVTEEGTLVDVSEGKVHLDHLAYQRQLLIAANETGTASQSTLQISQLTWPYRRDGLSYLFSSLESSPAKDNKPLTVVRHAESRSLRPTPLELRGDAVLSEARWFYELNGGYLVSADAGPDIFAASRGGSELTLEAVFSPASMDQAGHARIISLADDADDEPDFALAQDGPDFTFCLKTDAKSAPATPPRLTINAADSPLHLTLTYRHGEFIAYKDGMEIARSNDLLGSLAWRSGPLTVGADASGERPWRGIMEALALYNRCLEPGEVARNARNYRLLARGSM